jgi:hypothetical protein
VYAELPLTESETGFWVFPIVFAAGRPFFFAGTADRESVTSTVGSGFGLTSGVAAGSAGLGTGLGFTCCAETVAAASTTTSKAKLNITDNLLLIISDRPTIDRIDITMPRQTKKFSAAA